MATGLSPDEDAELRRLHFFSRFGVVANAFARRYDELRRRDRRETIREPEEDVRTSRRAQDRAS